MQKLQKFNVHVNTKSLTTTLTVAAPTRLAAERVAIAQWRKSLGAGFSPLVRITECNNSERDSRIIDACLEMESIDFAASLKQPLA